MNTSANILNAIGFLCETFWQAVYGLSVAAIAVGGFLDTARSRLHTRAADEPDAVRQGVQPTSGLVKKQDSPEVPDFGLPKISVEEIRRLALHTNARGTTFHPGAC